jgi:hypothetical protein
MSSRDLELAAEFSKMVGAPHLLAYLDVEEGAASPEARAKLKARRKFMQGMQGNPKYKREALFLIRHFGSLDAVLEDVPAYLADARRRAESVHLPVIEMAIRGVLAAGGLNDDQEEYLRRNAVELGIAERTFRQLLYRVGGEMGVSVPTPGGTPTPAPPADRDALDLYELLGVTSSATVAEITTAWEARTADLAAIPDRAEAESRRRRLDIARKVLSHEVARQTYDGAAARTGPPARNRAHAPSQGVATAPPVRERLVEPRPDGPSPPPIARLEILSDPVRRLTLGRGITRTTLLLRNGGDGPLGGHVSADEPWLALYPQDLDPNLREHEIEVRIRRAEVPTETARAVVTIETDRGERAGVVFEIQRGSTTWTVVALVAAALLLVGVGSGLLLTLL